MIDREPTDSLATRLRTVAKEIKDNITQQSAAGAEALINISDMFLLCAGALDEKDRYAVNLRSAIGELSEENESLTAALHALKKELVGIQPELDLLDSIKQMQQSADEHIIIQGAMATADQLETRVALCVNACAYMSDEQLQYVGNVRSEGLFRYKKRHEEIVAKMQERIDQLSEVWVDENGTHWDPPTAWAYAQLCRGKNEQYDKIHEQEADLTAVSERAGK